MSELIEGSKIYILRVAGRVQNERGMKAATKRGVRKRHSKLARNEKENRQIDMLQF